MNVKSHIVLATVLGLIILVGGFIYFKKDNLTTEQLNNSQSVLPEDHQNGSRVVDTENKPSNEPNIATESKPEPKEDWQTIVSESSFSEDGILLANHTATYRSLMFGDYNKNVLMKGVGIVEQIFKEDGYDVALIRLLNQKDDKACGFQIVGGLTNSKVLLAFQHTPRILGNDLIAFKGMADNLKYTYETKGLDTVSVPIIYVPYYKSEGVGLEFEYYICGTVFGEPATESDIKRIFQK